MYFTRNKFGNGSGKYDYRPEAFDQDIQATREVHSQFKQDIKEKLEEPYYIEKQTSYGRFLTLDEKIEIIIDIIYNIRKGG